MFQINSSVNSFKYPSEGDHHLQNIHGEMKLSQKQVSVSKKSSLSLGMKCVLGLAVIGTLAGLFFKAKKNDIKPITDGPGMDNRFLPREDPTIREVPSPKNMALDKNISELNSVPSIQKTNFSEMLEDGPGMDNRFLKREDPTIREVPSQNVVLGEDIPGVNPIPSIKKPDFSEMLEDGPGMNLFLKKEDPTIRKVPSQNVVLGEDIPGVNPVPSIKKPDFSEMPSDGPGARYLSKYATSEKILMQSSKLVEMPNITIPSAGTFSFPLSEQAIQQLIKHASLASYGRGEDAIVDTSVRKTWQIPLDQIQITGKSWDKDFEGILNEVKNALGLFDTNISAKLYKFLIYDEGSFFKAHRDSKKSSEMFGTLVVVLPTEHEGGELIVRDENNHPVTIDLSGGKKTELKFSAFYANCEHEILPVKKGHRISLVYSLLKHPQMEIKKV